MEKTNSAQALVAHAAAFLPGDEDLDMTVVKDVVITLAEDPRGRINLDAALAQVNDPDTKVMVRSLIQRVVVEIEDDARNNATGASVTFQPWQMISLGATVTTFFAAAAGTISLPVAIPLAVVVVAGVGGTTWLRMKSSKAENRLKRRAELVKMLL